jgi:hypothetical protein
MKMGLARRRHPDIFFLQVLGRNAIAIDGWHLSLTARKRNNTMTEWIPFAEGEYWVEQAYLVSSDKSAIALENPVIEIAKSPQGKRHLKGQGMASNLLVIELLEENDTLDILLDLGGEFKYHLTAPQISSGKLFVPDVKSTLQFSPQQPWRQLSADLFTKEVSALKRIDI